ncbi:hypothetical protein GobsT_64080 [Gemmata obscuriglobus]|nr:hypothetical protein [Gemmata obscuriglobus]QEG31586.1 hypothetical protein GobsT_64080 [Gemmata obscuriglobus]VTS10928.1 unnamed protein product [Gemmata obscuriglobus UQM 2246]
MEPKSSDRKPKGTWAGWKERAEVAHRWGELLLRWGWFAFEVVKLCS